MKLTHEQIDELQEGPETNVLVAEKVMGWERLPPRKNISHGFAIPWWQECRWRVPNGGVTPDLDDFSGNIAAAWPVVEKLKRRNSTDDYMACWPVELSWLDDRNIWACGFIDNRGLCVEGVGDTAPLAICRAALKAVAAGRDTHDRR